MFLAIVATISLVSILKRYLSTWRRLPLPPGPKGWPLIGHILDVPTSFEWVTYHKWSQELGSDILYLNCAGTGILVLDSLDAAVDLLEKRSAIYSGRPRMPMLIELMGWGEFAFGFLDYGDAWRRGRRVVMEQFNMNAVQRYKPHISSATRRFLQRMAKDSSDIPGSLRHLAADTIFSLVYGLDINQGGGKEVLDVAKEVNQAMVIAAVPGRFLVDYIPLLAYVPAWVPGAHFQTLARRWNKMSLNMVDVAFNACIKLLADGPEAYPTFVSESLSKMETGANSAVYTKDRIKKVAGAMYLGEKHGEIPMRADLIDSKSDTTIAGFATCILALVSNPHVVQKAHEELDRVLAPGHLPEFSDEDSLPYVTAIVKEALRWRDITPMGLPHLLNADDVYRGYRIPKGTIVIGNSWAMLHNPEIYPDPFTFNPERFIKDGKIDTTVPDPNFVSFGFGRRVCPGKHMAYSSIWLAIASLLTVFDIGKAIDKNGVPIDPGEKYESALISGPLPFPCSLTPRSGKWVEILSEQKD